ncbi:lytic polysaccharide monooxygenase auxiliary activity family 9 protein [Streptomyces sp. NPDC054766]|uniref:lytic polysaccharide monooxygenase auxiliary activity family 9 protein n=1 Tax=Streptomyces rhizosphaerihabitans TaxID=1266770 RepID=UPI0021BE42EC|nr:lytic polysaccharide monooxygenase [Streptomyces rhizosphaerihabitans]MCT9009875.1 lytic polysaccharide monooxygenase [Streptomyces rhizosphaerihabitans]
MSARRKAAGVAVLGIASLALSTLAAAPASAHGSMGDPVSRVSQCYAEGPENPRSDACKAAVAAGGTQALYDWNGIRIGEANGRHQALIPDGRLCSAGNAEFKGLDLARSDWPATSVSSGSYTFKYRVTAPHKGTFKVYITKAGYDPSQPPAWGDLDLAHPVATVTDPAASGGFYTFSGTLPERSGKQLLYAVWQRSDSPEAFYSCSDVAFGGSGADAGGGKGAGGGTSPAPSASAPSDQQIVDGSDKSTVEHHGHGDNDASTSAEPTASAGTTGADGTDGDTKTAEDARAAAESADSAGNLPEAAGSSRSLAETGGDSSTSYVAIGGAAALALGAAALFASVRRRATPDSRRGR